MFDPQTTVRKRPHFHTNGGNVTFLNAAKPLPAISDEAYRILEGLDAPITMSDIGGAHVDAVQELSDRGLIDLIVPIIADNRQSILVIEPHGDDAALSIGALMWARRHEVAFSLITLASRSNYTSSFHTGRDFFNRDDVSELRRAEGEIYMQHLGGTYAVGGFNEATMRYNNSDWSVGFFNAHRSCVAINNNRRAADSILSEWTVSVAQMIQDSDATEVWFPLGAGTHSDHDLTRNACLQALMQNPEIMEGKKAYLYKDVPYGIDCQEHTDRLIGSLRTAGAEIADAHVDITDDYDQKLALLAIFASQFKVAHVQPGVKRSATSGSPKGRKMEHMWEMTRCPNVLETAKLFIQAPKAIAMKPQFDAWVADGAAVKRVRVLALGASGNWSKDEAELKARFPNAAITVYATSATQSEIALHRSDDVTLTKVGRGSKAWAALALKLAVQPSAKTLFIAGDREGQAASLSRLWLFSDTVVVDTSDIMTLALSGDL